jgi:hypothetical protein
LIKGKSAWAKGLNAVQPWVQILSKMNVTDHHQCSTNLMAQVFLAYAAEDEPNRQTKNCASAAAAVSALRQLLTQANISYWQRPYPWPATAATEAVISRATETCDNYVLVLSPRSLADACCLQGLLFALSLNKRIVPLLVETVPTEHLPEPLQTLKIIDLQSAITAREPTASTRQMLQTLHHDADYHRTHTQLLVKALEWERQRRDPALLLQGDNLTWYQNWLAVAQARSHHRPIQLQTLYVSESVRHDYDLGPGWLKRWLEKPQHR